MSENSESAYDRITELGQARSDEYTKRLLAFVQDLEASCPEPFIPLLADIAMVRTLIVHLVVQDGPKWGLEEARIAFNATFDQMKSILENMGGSERTVPPMKWLLRATSPFSDPPTLG